MGKTFISLLSGGLDSVVSTYLAAQDAGVGETLFFDYGQRALKREREAAGKISKAFGASLRVIKLPFLAEVTQTALVMNDKVIPQIKTSKLDDRSETEKSAQQVWVPNRNGLFLNVAASLAEGLGYTEIVVGFNAEEAATFSDNSANFVNKAEEFFRLSTLQGIKVHAPTLGMTKTEIVQQGLALKVPFEDLWSCYLGGRKQCGRCESCLRSLRAFESAGLLEKLAPRYEQIPKVA
ncbi:MAG: 7-cyano-7-deazaguanine synthase QueC [bacterium]|nr:7-cyano-7-deazaguanine synthase QueC [bacterium]